MMLFKVIHNDSRIFDTNFVLNMPKGICVIRNPRILNYTNGKTNVFGIAENNGWSWFGRIVCSDKNGEKYKSYCIEDKSIDNKITNFIQS